MTKRKKAWIWFWYNDVTRSCLLMGIHLIPLALLLIWLNIEGETIKLSDIRLNSRLIVPDLRPPILSLIS